MQISPTGGKLAYLGYNAFPGAEGNTALFSAHVSTRTSAGWESTDWTPAVPKAEVLRIYKVAYAFSQDLSQAVLQVPLVSLAPGATPYAFNLFRRHTNGSYTTVNSAPPLVPVEAICEPEELASCFEFIDLTAYAGASSDMNHVIFESTAQLTPVAPQTGREGLYESENGQVRLVGILPDGNAASESTAGAGSRASYTQGTLTRDRRVEHAISEDGSKIVFESPSDGGQPDPAQSGQVEVYDRINGRETIELSAPSPGATPENNTASNSTFWTASNDGSRVFFTSAGNLTTPSKTGNAGGEDLYEYNFTKPAGERLTDLTVDANPADSATGAMVQGVLDASRDGSYVYFVAEGQLVAGKGVDGQPNLYMVHNDGVPVFIATLSGSGSCNLPAPTSSDSCDWTAYPVELEAYVTPDGRHVGFMSTMRVPTVDRTAGFDNTDARSGQPDSEVYEYSAPTEAEEAKAKSGQVMCVSCDPSGARPTGNALIGGVIQTGQGEFPYGAISTPFERVRPISDSGSRVFYAAPSPNRPYSQVYEYEQGGEGSCSYTYGCQYVISDAGDGEGKQFVGMSADGNDAFFVTARSLVSTDLDNLRDVYDARVDGGFPTATAEAACTSECRRAEISTLSESQLLGVATGKSGNLVEKPVAPLTRNQRLATAFRACRAKLSKRQRARCEARVRRRYRVTMRNNSTQKASGRASN